MIEDGKTTLALELLQRIECSFTEHAQAHTDEAQHVRSGKTNLEVADERLVTQRLDG